MVTDGYGESGRKNIKINLFTSTVIVCNEERRKRRNRC